MPLNKQPSAVNYNLDWDPAVNLPRSEVDKMKYEEFLKTECERLNQRVSSVELFQECCVCPHMEDQCRKPMECFCPHFYNDDGTIKRGGRIPKANRDQSIKHDNDPYHPQVEYIPDVSILNDIARVYEYGAKKGYERDSWKGVEYERYKAAFLRHMIAWWVNEFGCDYESNMSHFDHMLWNVYTLWYMRKHFDSHPFHFDQSKIEGGNINENIREVQTTKPESNQQSRADGLAKTFYEICYKGLNPATLTKEVRLELESICGQIQYHLKKVPDVPE